MQRHRTNATDRSRRAGERLALTILVALAGLSTAQAHHPAPTQSDASKAPCPLDLRLVDLTTAAEVDQLETEDSASSAAPVLNLGPRVASIVRDVFGDQSDSATSTPAVAPIAGATKDAAEPQPEDSESADLPNSAYSPLKIHREMYRTDI